MTQIIVRNGNCQRKYRYVENVNYVKYKYRYVEKGAYPADFQTALHIFQKRYLLKDLL